MWDREQCSHRILEPQREGTNETLEGPSLSLSEIYSSKPLSLPYRLCPLSGKSDENKS